MNNEPGLTLLGQKTTKYPTNPDEARLEVFKNKYQDRDYLIRFDCPEFTSMCPITGQPDFAKIKITYIPHKDCIESKSLKIYLFSFRNSGMFHEEIVNRVLDDVIKAANPKWARVRGIMNRRGGILIDVTSDYYFPGFSSPLIK
jgi:7-cyano-7-deazaguanine reductase